MSTQIRQSELFASKDWRILYRAFTQINFNASDPASINAALRDYIRINYPEDFNDWIESSEFVAIIDLLSYLAGTLAFKFDINARENFLETAEARESVLRLARFLSYNPSRNRNARGLLKITEVSTDDDVTDAAGVSLTGVRVPWNSSDDPDWFEKFSTVLNEAFIQTNPFGIPMKSGLVGGVATQLYRVDCRMGDNNFNFSSAVSGTSMDFQLCNGDFTDGETFNERTPDPDSTFHLFYRNDSLGNNSADTGFFMLFKQGTLRTTDFRIPSPVENQLLDINVANVNQDDVWVQQINDGGYLVDEWKRVPAIFSQNITFNTFDSTVRKIYSAVTRENDQISIRFGDGLFSEAPVGNIRVNYRVSNGLSYAIQPADLQNLSTQIRYYNRAGVVRTLTIKFALQSIVTNAVPAETEQAVRERAPSVYAAQNRMVSGEDYNTFPLSSNLATKIKAVNRIYSGHSRHIDLNDPTANYSDVTVFCEDGMLYREKANYYEEIPLLFNRTPDELVSLYLQPLLRQLDIRSYVHDVIQARVQDPTNPDHYAVPVSLWTQITTPAKFSSTGYFSVTNRYFRVGTTILFRYPDQTTKWATIVAVAGPVNIAPDAGLRGPVTLNEPVPSGSIPISLVPNYDPELDLVIRGALAAKFGLNLSFTLWYDPVLTNWVIGDPASLSALQTPPVTGAIKIASIDYISGALWRISARGLKYVFESKRKVKFYHSGAKVLDSQTGLFKHDTITALVANTDPLTNYTTGLDKDYTFNVASLFYYQNGGHEPRRVQLDFVDGDADGQADLPDSFIRLIDQTSVPNSTLFWVMGEQFGDPSYLPLTNVNVYATVTQRTADTAAVEGQVAYQLDTERFWMKVSGVWVQQPTTNYRVANGRGINVAQKWVNTDNTVTTPHAAPVYFLWKHYAPSDHRIDPSITNIIDLFVLSSEYDYLVRTWIEAGADAATLPTPPSEVDLKISFSGFEDYKIFSDQLVWRPVRYKYLFGPGSEATNTRVTFKVVKLPDSTLADGEIKSRLIRAVNVFFDVARWDFGETFYYTELAAFIHQQLATSIGSVVIVPMNEEAAFGDGFEVKARSDEIFISTAQVGDVQIINSNTATNLRIR